MTIQVYHNNTITSFSHCTIRVNPNGVLEIINETGDIVAAFAVWDRALTVEDKEGK